MTFCILPGDCLESLRALPDGAAQCCVTSPPYFGLRDYGHAGQIGLEETPDAYVAKLVEVFRNVRRVLRDDGTLWLNLGDSYASTGGHTAQGAGSVRTGRSNVDVQNARKGFAGGDGIKTKDLIGIPWMVAFALRADGWYLRQDIIWHKPNPMPESVTDRCTKAHEYLFLLSKSPRYYYDIDSIREPCVTGGRKGERRSYNSGSASSYRHGSGHEEMRGPQAGLPLNPLGRNRRDVWTVPPQAVQRCAFRHLPARPHRTVRPCRLPGRRGYPRPLHRQRHNRGGCGHARAAVYRLRVEPRLRPHGGGPRIRSPPGSHLVNRRPSGILWHPF